MTYGDDDERDRDRDGDGDRHHGGGDGDGGGDGNDPDDRDDAERLYPALLDEIRAEFPRFRLVDKRTRVLQRSIGAALALLTAGGQSSYLTRYVTTLGQTVYLPDGFSARPARDRVITLRHERVHLRQFRRWTWPGMALLYLLFPLPVGLAWARMRFERAAYEETLRASLALHGPARVCNAAFRADLIAQFTGPAYGYMWPFRRSLERWYDAFVAALLAGRC